MLCLCDSIRLDDADLPHGFQVAYDAPSLTELFLAAWALARLIAVDVVESVLRHWAHQPTLWPPLELARNEVGRCGARCPEARFSTPPVA
jgi:hypothetical protein